MDQEEQFRASVLAQLEAVYRAAVALCDQTAQADDLVQMTYFKALQKSDSFARGSNIKAWLLRILRNSWIDELRRRQTTGPLVSIEPELLEVAVEDDAPASDDWLEQFSDEQVIRALQALPEPMRMAVYCRDVEALSQEEIAEIMDVAVGTVKSRVSRGRALLREQLAEYARDLGFTEKR